MYNVGITTPQLKDRYTDFLKSRLKRKIKY